MEQNANALPKVTLGQYKGLEFTRRVRPVSEKAVELEAANLTRTHAPFAPVEKSAARGMRVTLDFEGFMDGAPIPVIKGIEWTTFFGHMPVLGGERLVEAFEVAVEEDDFAVRLGVRCGEPILRRVGHRRSSAGMGSSTPWWNCMPMR